MPDQAGRTVLVTGANSGLGLATSLEFARHGARVLMACRDPGRGQQALDKVSAVAVGGGAELVALDLADLSSVRSAAGDVATRCERLDVLINNAGVMATPYEKTVDGFERQIGTTHLGHFALTGLLLPPLLAAPAGRVVTVSSGAHQGAKGINLHDLQSERSYGALRAYSRSKLANLLFAAELDRRARAAGAQLISVAAHPGLAATSLMRARPGEKPHRMRSAAVALAFRLFGQSEAAGALPQLYAATAPDVLGSEYFGPSGFQEQRGAPTRVGRSLAAQDVAAGAQLWEASERLTGVTYPMLSPTT